MDQLSVASLIYLNTPHPGLIDFGLFLKQSIFTSDHRRDCYKRIIRPRMIILITGASHTGKTLLAQRMLEKYKYPYLSIDHLKMGLIRSGNTFLTPKDDDALTEYLWPIVREMIKTAIENSQNLIVEGCYVPFDWRRDFDENYLSSIRFICLAMTGRYIDEHFKDITGYGSAIESRLDDSECSLCGLKEDNKRCLEGFIQAGEQVLLIDDSFERVLEALLESYTRRY